LLAFWPLKNGRCDGKQGKCQMSVFSEQKTLDLIPS
jgi:hypothetical protein